MQFQKLYIDSRDRVSGTQTELEYQLSTNVVVQQESIAVLDTVLIPNSWYTVTKNKNDRIYIREEINGSAVFRIATLEEGYYDVLAMATQIAAALTRNSTLVNPYTCVYNTTIGKFEVSNSWSNNAELLYIWSEAALLKSGASPLSNWGVTNRSDLRGAFRQIGMLYGELVYGGTIYGTDPLVMNGGPNLQAHTQVFIKGSLGIPGLSQGPRGTQDILRRCVITAPLLGLNYDPSATHYDNIRIAPVTYSTLKFKLCGYYGDEIDLQGQDWSFSVVIYPKD